MRKYSRFWRLVLCFLLSACLACSFSVGASAAGATVVVGEGEFEMSQVGRSFTFTLPKTILTSSATATAKYATLSANCLVAPSGNTFQPAVVYIPNGSTAQSNLTYTSVGVKFDDNVSLSANVEYQLEVSMGARYTSLSVSDASLEVASGVTWELLSLSYEDKGNAAADWSNSSLWSAIFKITVSADTTTSVKANFVGSFNPRLSAYSTSTIFTRHFTFVGSVPDEETVQQVIKDQWKDNEEDKDGIGGGINDAVSGLQDNGADGEADAVQDSVAGLFSGGGSTELKFPGFSMDVGGETHQVWDDTTFNLSAVEDGFPALMVAVRTILVALVYLAVIAYTVRLSQKIFGGD